MKNLGEIKKEGLKAHSYSNEYSHGEILCWRHL